MSLTFLLILRWFCSEFLTVQTKVQGLDFQIHLHLKGFILLALHTYFFVASEMVKYGNEMGGRGMNSGKTVCNLLLAAKAMFLISEALLSAWSRSDPTWLQSVSQGNGEGCIRTTDPFSPRDLAFYSQTHCLFLLHVPHPHHCHFHYSSLKSR